VEEDYVDAWASKRRRVGRVKYSKRDWELGILFGMSILQNILPSAFTLPLFLLTFTVTSCIHTLISYNTSRSLTYPSLLPSPNHHPCNPVSITPHNHKLRDYPSPASPIYPVVLPVETVREDKGSQRAGRW
jgi:hypothetical protein